MSPGASGESVELPAYRRIYRYLASYVLVERLENRGSVARDHLANERTFLAWLRASISLASIGIGIAQLFRLTRAEDSVGFLLRAAASDPVKDLGRDLGLAFLVLSIVFIALGLQRYLDTQIALTQEPSQFPPSRIVIGISSVSVLVLVIATILAVFKTK